MTDQPTNHRAEAERWLTKTEQLVGPDEDDETMTILLTIGHALLALTGPEKPTTIVHVSGNPSKAEIEALRATIRQPPPLSPSED